MRTDPSSRHRHSGRGSIRPWLVVALTTLICVPLWLWAQPPAWWAQRGVLIPEAPADDYAAVNQGQVKHIAKQAYLEMEARLPGGAGPTLTALIDSWATPNPSSDDYAAINLGQAKSLAKPFYDRLSLFNYQGQPLTAGQIYPWDGSAFQADDYALINIGQIKNLFSFELISIDADHDGLPDSWEMEYFGNLAQTAEGDFDGDGATNGAEYTGNSDPVDSDSTPNEEPNASLSIFPAEASLTVLTDGETQQSLQLNNLTANAINYGILYRGEANTFGYDWTTSDDIDGPSYVWEDISSIGTRLNIVSVADDKSEMITLPFYFTFYGKIFDRAYVSSNGYLTFGRGFNNFENGTLPSAAMPVRLVAALFKDLSPRSDGTVYYHGNAERAIVQFENVQAVGEDWYYTFQIVLRKDGSIVYYYKEVDDVNSVTAGIQNATGDEGFSINYGNIYLKNEQAILISPHAHRWLEVNEEQGSIPANSTKPLILNAHPPGKIYPGNYTGLIEFYDIAAPSAITQLNVTVHVRVPATSEDTDGDSLPDAWELLHFGTLETFGKDDPDSDGLANVHEYLNNTDPNMADAEPNPDTDGDGIDDDWEYSYFSSLDEDAFGDFDQDGLSNIEEYALDTDPTVADSDGDGISDLQDTFPLDYYNDIAPVVMVLGGDNQIAAPGDFNTAPFEIAVFDQAGQPLRNAPVYANPDMPGGRLAESSENGAALYYWLELRTDQDGRVRFWYKHPLGFGIQSQIYVFIGANTVILTASTGQDSDGDGLSDEQEALLGTDPHKADTDGDGLGDAVELGANYAGAPGTYPSSPTQFSTSGIRLPDAWVFAHGYSLTNPPAETADPDDDGLDNYTEYLNGTDPFDPDSDQNGIPDGGNNSRFIMIRLPFTQGFAFAPETGAVLAADSGYYKRWFAGEATALAAIPPSSDSVDSSGKRTVTSVRAYLGPSGTAVLGENISTSRVEYTPTYRRLQTSDLTLRKYTLDGQTIPIPLERYTGHTDFGTWDGDLYWDERDIDTLSLDSTDNLWMTTTVGLAPYMPEYPARGELRISGLTCQLANGARVPTPLRRSYTFGGVNNHGIYIGSVQDGANTTYYVGPTTVGYNPIWINKNNSVLGSDGIHFSNGTTDPLPDLAPGTTVTWLDSTDRPRGYQDGRPIVWDKFGSAPVSYLKTYYSPVMLPDGWITTHKIAPHETEVQLGQATRNNETTAFLLLRGGLRVDANHDGTITDLPNDSTTEQLPYRFWSNDDDDNPGASFLADYLNSVVDGADDLADFFPVFLDIKQLLTVLPPSASVKYKLKQADGGLNFVYTNLTRATAFDYQNATTATTGYGPNFNQAAAVATTQQITAAGVELPAAFLTNIKDNDQGVILIEMRGMTAAPLKLVVEKDNVEIAEVAVNIATGEIEWVSQHTANPVEEFKVPAAYANYTTKPLGWLDGQRYFVDGASATTQSFRIRINVKVKMAGAAGKTVELKAFDVDDPTPADWDPDNVLDAGGLGGDDNRSGGAYPGDNGSIHEGTFSTAFLKTTTVTLDANGEATAEFILSQKPGNNYRIAGVLNESASQIDALQVTNATASRYVAPDAKPVRSFAGVTSPTLTIWRKLHVEMDSMAAVPTEVSSSQKNYATGVVVAEHTPGGPFVSLDLSDSLSDRSRYTEQGAHIEIDGVGTYSVFFEAVDSDTVKFYVPGGLPSSAVGRAYKIYDDDFEIIPLPLDGIANQVIDRLKAYYAPTFIEPRPAQNPDTVVGFVLNQDVPPVFATSVTWNDAQNTEDSAYFWQHLVTLGHQGPTSDDMDADLNQYLGVTLKDGVFGRYSAIFTETIRDSDYMGAPRDTTTATQARFIDWIAMIAAHELGHAPGSNSEASDHAETGIMKKGGTASVQDSFSAQSILRFRSTTTWSQP